MKVSQLKIVRKIKYWNLKPHQKEIPVPKVHILKNKTLTIIQIYAPVATEEEIEDIYNNLSETVNHSIGNKKKQLLLIGDFKRQIGQRCLKEEEVMEVYNHGTRNQKGGKLIAFSLRNNLKNN